MDRLWAPWRMQYVSAPPPDPDASDCFLCRGLAESSDRENQILLRTASSAVVLNRYPYNNGHLLVAPLAHKAQLSDLTDAEMLDGQHVLRRMVSLLTQTMRPDGFNLGANLGRVAGAGLPGHLHWHIVPRWNGDTNFMPVLSDVKVISQSLAALYDTLAAALSAAS